jgi:hypothetical protein
MQHAGRQIRRCDGRGQRHRQRPARGGQRRRRERAHSPQQHTAGKVAAEMIHLADQRDRRTKDEGTNGGTEIGEDRLT